MQSSSFFVYVYRYYLFAIAIISNAIICSAAAWNLPVSQNADLRTQSHIDIYMFFLGAFSVLVFIIMLFADVFSQRAFTGLVWVECLWIDFLWLLHILGATLTTSNLPRSMCTPRVESINGNSCKSVKLLMAFSWICTINLLIYLIFLVISAILHQRQDDTVWRAQVKSYPWYLDFYCHKLGSSPELPRAQPVGISAPQPWRPIRILRLSLLSSLSRPEHTPDRPSGVSEHSTSPPPPPPPPPAMQQAMPVPSARTSLYPLHVLAVLEPTVEPAIPGTIVFHPRETYSRHHHHRSSSSGGGPPPLSNWPRADIMSRPPQRHAVGRKRVPASALPPVAEPPHPRARREEGRPPRSSSMRVSSDQRV